MAFLTCPSLVSSLRLQGKLKNQQPTTRMQTSCLTAARGEQNRVRAPSDPHFQRIIIKTSCTNKREGNSYIILMPKPDKDKTRKIKIYRSVDASILNEMLDKLNLAVYKKGWTPRKWISSQKSKVVSTYETQSIQYPLPTE